MGANQSFDEFFSYWPFINIAIMIVLIMEIESITLASILHPNSFILLVMVLFYGSVYLVLLAWYKVLKWFTPKSKRQSKQP